MTDNLLDNLDKLHTTGLGAVRIKKNLELGETDVVAWCRQQVISAQRIFQKGKNWYVCAHSADITINASSFTIITAHKIKSISSAPPAINRKEECPKEKNTKEDLGGLFINISREHRFGTDAFLLSDFAAPLRKDIALDLCSGCGIVALLWFRAGKAAPQSVTSLEIASDAVELQHATVAENSLQAAFRPVCGDLREVKSIFEHGGFSLVTCNPPYFSQGSGFAPAKDASTLARHETAATIDDVCAAAKHLLKYSGRLCLCHRPERLADVIAAMRTAGIEPKRLRFVQQREGSAPWLFLIEGKKGAKPSLKIMPPLIIEDNSGAFSPEVLKIYNH